MQEGIRAAEFPFSQTDDSRSENASGYGGFELTDDDLLGRHRSVISEMVSKAGRKLLSGDFNLTRISFPIRCMSKDSAISVMATNISSYPFYMGRAADLSD